MITKINDHVEKVLVNYEEEFKEATQLFDAMYLAEVGELMKRSARLLCAIREIENTEQAIILSRDMAQTQGKTSLDQAEKIMAGNWHKLPIV